MRAAAWILVALLLSGVALVGVELGKGALNEPAPKIANPCQPRAGRTGGIDTTIQRIVLDGLDGAACRLHTTREELVLSLGGGTGLGTRAAGTRTRSRSPSAPGYCVRWTRPCSAATSRASSSPPCAGSSSTPRWKLVAAGSA